MNASKTNQELSLIGFLLTVSIGLPIYLLLPLLFEFSSDSHLLNSGIVTQGTIVSIESVNCSENASPSPSYDVHFTDNNGQPQDDPIECDSSLVGKWSVGESITIIYAPDSPWTITLLNKLPEKVQLEQKELVGLLAYLIGVILLIVLRKRGFLKGNWFLALVNKGEIKPWWQILIVIPTGTFIIFFTIGPLVRYLVGLPFHTSSQGNILILASISDTICWMVFAIVGHRKQNFWTYFPWAILAYYLVLVAPAKWSLWSGLRAQDSILR